jgi:hypothetical protein
VFSGSAPGLATAARFYTASPGWNSNTTFPYSDTKKTDAEQQKVASRQVAFFRLYIP